MEQKTLARWLKIALAIVAACGLAVYGAIAPGYGLYLKGAYPEMANRFWPWLIFLWLTGVPICWALALGWKIADSIGKDRSFTLENAERLKRISLLAAVDAVFLFAGNGALLLMNMSHPGVFLMMLLACLAGWAVMAAAACLSHLVKKAAALQEQSDLTI